MAFAVICKSCQARFLLNDDLLRRKVAGRVVTVRCRQCHAAIEVDASNIDLRSAPRHEPPTPKAAAAVAATSGAAEAPPATRTEPSKLKAPRPAPSPPRPTNKSTLMGIGGPGKPQGAPELVALSPGLLHLPPTPVTEDADFPAPPPPPEIEELNGDFEVTEPETVGKLKASPIEEAPESLDDFAEELPPSLPPLDDELPSSTGTPSLAALTHHPMPAKRTTTSDDFLANVHAAVTGDVMPMAAEGAPTIDVSSLPAAPANATKELDLSALDVPLTGKQTLPLFSLADDEAKTPTPGIVGRAAAAGALETPARVSASGAATTSPLPVSSKGADRDAPRSRRNVVAPTTKSVPPPAGAARRSGLAVPLLLAVAAAAAFLIWKRTATKEGVAVTPATESSASTDLAPQAIRPVTPTEPTSAASPVAAAPQTPPADDVTFETTPSRAPTPPAAAPRGKETSEPLATKTSPEKASAREPATESVAPPKTEKPTEAAPATPAEPAGPFDRAAAAAALTAGAAQASACRKEGDPSGVASVVITFAPSGRVTSATIGGPPFAGTPTGGCIAAALRKARVPPFEGDRVTVSKTIVVQ